MRRIYITVSNLKHMRLVVVVVVVVVVVRLLPKVVERWMSSQDWLLCAFLDQPWLNFGVGFQIVLLDYACIPEYLWWKTNESFLMEAREQNFPFSGWPDKDRQHRASVNVKYERKKTLVCIRGNLSLHKCLWLTGYEDHIEYLSCLPVWFPFMIKQTSLNQTSKWVSNGGHAYTTAKNNFFII